MNSQGYRAAALKCYCRVWRGRRRLARRVVKSRSRSGKRSKNLFMTSRNQMLSIRRKLRCSVFMFSCKNRFISVVRQTFQLSAYLIATLLTLLSFRSCFALLRFHNAVHLPILPKRIVKLFLLLIFLEKRGINVFDNFNDRFKAIKFHFYSSPKLISKFRIFGMNIREFLGSEIRFALQFENILESVLLELLLKTTKSPKESE